ncbi:MAG: WD40 repeat domain-containing protein [Chloroflexi bacterium]|nr:WD40 repeat domain-containing protein [Chloroflexota bacterium]
MNTFRPKGRAVPPSTTITLERHWRAQLDGHIISLRWSPDGSRLAAAIADGPITILAADGAHLHELPGHAMGTTALDWQPVGHGEPVGQPLLASAGQDGHVRQWDAVTGAQVQALRHATSWVERVAYHPSGRYLAAAAGKRLRVWDGLGNLVCEHHDHASTIADLAWRPGTVQIAAVAYGGTTLWPLDAAAPLRRYAWQGSSLVLAWSPDASMFATGDQDQTVHFWYSDSGKDLQMWGYETKMRELAWDPTSRYLATGGGRDAVVWDTRASKKGPEGSHPVMLALHEQFLSALAYQHRETQDAPALLASAGQDGLVALWRPTRGQKPLAQHGLNAPVSQLAWSPDDRALAVGGADGSIVVLTLT